MNTPRNDLLRLQRAQDDIRRLDAKLDQLGRVVGYATLVLAVYAAALLARVFLL